MKRNRINKAAAFLLLATALLASCGDNADGSKDKGTGSETVNPALEGNDALLAEAVAALPDKDYGNEAFTFLIPDNQGSSAQHIDIYAESDNGEPIVSAVFKRNSLLSEYLNVRITEALPPNAEESPCEVARIAIRANDHTYDVVVDALAWITPLLPEGLFLDWNEVPGINMEAEWWDQDMREDLSIGGRNYLMTGDISIRDNQASMCIIFNRDMASEYDYDLFSMVRSNEWTIDALRKMAKEVTDDTTGDSIMTADDRWGFLSSSFATYALWTSTGEALVSKDKDDLPMLNDITNRASDVMDTVVELQSDRCTYITTGDTHQQAHDITQDIFRRGDALFYSAGLSDLTELRDSEVSIGLLPSPKYDENQTEYMQSYTPYWATAFAIPANAENLDRTGTVLEAMAHLSKYTLTPAYFDITLEGKAIKDEDSIEMLDIILSSRNYDFGNVTDWGGMFGAIGYKVSSTLNLSTIHASHAKAAERQIEDYIEAFDALN